MFHFHRGDTKLRLSMSLRVPALDVAFCPAASIQDMSSTPPVTATLIEARSTKPTRRQVLGAGLLLLGGCQKTETPHFHGVDITGANYARDFQLLDADNHERTLADFKGRAVLIFFGFTQCPDVCPTALIRAAEVKRLLGADGDRLQVLFVTLDPERDTPEVLKAYTAAFDPTFMGLHADLQRTADTASAFKVYFKKVPTGASYTLDHSAFSYVYDPAGRLRLLLKHEQSAEDCADDLRQLLHTA